MAIIQFCLFPAWLDDGGPRLGQPQGGRASVCVSCVAPVRRSRLQPALTLTLFCWDCTVITPDRLLWDLYSFTLPSPIQPLYYLPTAFIFWFVEPQVVGIVLFEIIPDSRVVSNISRLGRVSGPTKSQIHNYLIYLPYIAGVALLQYSTTHYTPTHQLSSSTILMTQQSRSFNGSHKVPLFSQNSPRITRHGGTAPSTFIIYILYILSREEGSQFQRGLAIYVQDEAVY